MAARPRARLHLLCPSACARRDNIVLFFQNAAVTRDSPRLPAPTPPTEKNPPENQGRWSAAVTLLPRLESITPISTAARCHDTNEEDNEEDGQVH